MPYGGRGGAGNIQAIEQEKARVSADIEAGQPAAESYSQPPPSREEQPYAHSGRGGAGNYYSPQELKKTGHFDDANPLTGDGVNSIGSGFTVLASNQNKSAPAPQATRTHGRGGAGNYAYDASENQEKALRRRLEEDRVKQEKLKADIEQGVQDTLAMPPKAKLPGQQPY